MPPATAEDAGQPDTITPAPWVPYTRAGCNVGEIATANVELENTAVDIPKVFGAGSPEDEQLINDPDSFKDQETDDYVGLGDRAQGSRVLRGRHGREVRPEGRRARPRWTDLVPDEPGGYSGYQALFGNKYLAPELGGGKPDDRRGRVPGHQRGRQFF